MCEQPDARRAGKQLCLQTGNLAPRLEISVNLKRLVSLAEGPGYLSSVFLSSKSEELIKFSGLFWDDGNVLHLDLGIGYKQACNCQNLSNLGLVIFYYMKIIPIFFFKKGEASKFNSYLGVAPKDTPSWLQELDVGIQKPLKIIFTKK